MDEPTRPVFLSREQRNVLEWATNHLRCHTGRRTYETRHALKQYVLGMASAAEAAVAAWDAAPADAWAEIADEKRTHRAHCRDGDCFAENVMLRLGGIKPVGLSPFDAPAADAP